MSKGNVYRVYKGDETMHPQMRLDKFTSINDDDNVEEVT